MLQLLDALFEVIIDDMIFTPEAGATAPVSVCMIAILECQRAI